MQAYPLAQTEFHLSSDFATLSMHAEDEYCVGLSDSFSSE